MALMIQKKKPATIDYNYDPNYMPNSDYGPDQFNIFETEGASEQLINEAFGPTNNIQSDVLIEGKGKIASFIGASGSGSSFIINNLSLKLSQEGIKVAIVDLTTNKNSYYVYTNNDPKLTKIAQESLKNLSSGIPEGLEINKDLVLFTALPDEFENFTDKDMVLKTLSENFDIALLDCDFRTEVEYFSRATEIYLVQTLDTLTIQPLTKFLSDLKTRNLLDESKLRVIINKYIKTKLLNEKVILAGLSRYNEPSMTLQRDLFNKDTVKYISIPIEEANYKKYLEEVANCKITLNGYSQGFISSLDKLKYMVYPLIPDK